MAPHFTLLADARDDGPQAGWRFVIRAADGSEQLAADDCEPAARRERLELLAIVRGLEALEQPSRVTVVTTSQYVRRGMAYGLEEWRANGWTWEHFGQMVLVKNHDLWQRLDRALGIHDVHCRQVRIDRPHGTAPHNPRPGVNRATSATERPAPRLFARLRQALGGFGRRQAALAT